RRLYLCRRSRPIPFVAFWKFGFRDELRLNSSDSAETIYTRFSAASRRGHTPRDAALDLVSRVGSSLAKSSDGREDFISGFVPRKWFGRFVRQRQVVPNGGDQLTRAAVDAAPELLVGQLDEPALDQVQPGRARGREVQMIARPLHQPAVNRRRFVRGVIVEDQVNVEIQRDSLIDRVKESSEFARAMPRMTFADHRARLHIQRGKQCRGA